MSVTLTHSPGLYGRTKYGRGAEGSIVEMTGLHLTKYTPKNIGAPHYFYPYGFSDNDAKLYGLDSLENRCQTSLDDPNELAFVCFSTFRINPNFTVLYRYKPEYLPFWYEIHKNVHNTISSFFKEI